MTKVHDTVSEFAEFGETTKLSLADPNVGSAFAAALGAKLQRNVENPAWLHGQRVQSMFEALLIALGDYRYLKVEDAGSAYPKTSKIPDFRVVLSSGEQWLIEVKNVFERDPLKQQRLLVKRSYREALEHYAAATGAKLKLAVYWARWSIWTLVSPELLTDANGDVGLDMQRAMVVNELGLLGDRTIATVAPLRISLLADPARTSPIDDDGNVVITFGEVQFCSNEKPVTDRLEREIALMLMEYGDWLCDGPTPVIEGSRLDAIEFCWNPEEPTGQGFDGIGNLSRIFSRYFAQMTLKDGAVVQLRAPLRPGWFAPLLDPNYKCQALPLWRFELRPNYALAKAA